MLSKSDPWSRLRLIKHNILALDEDVAKDGKANASVDLDATVASGASRVGRCIVDVRARDGVQLAVDDEREGR